MPLRQRLNFQGGRQLLLDAALEAIKVAEDPANEGDRVLVARSFHTATVYLEVLSSFNAVSPGACCLRLCGVDAVICYRYSLLLAESTACLTISCRQ